MRRVFQILVLTAWLVASGAHWDLVQSFAWARMVVAYSEDLPLVEAVQETFNPKNLCFMCKAVRDAKEKESGMPSIGQKPEGKWLLALPKPSATGVIAPAKQRVVANDEHLSAQWAAEPALQPPRLA